MDLFRGLYTRFRVLIHEVAKFGAVGICAFFITIVGTNVLRYGVGLGPLTSVTVATVVATVFAFLGNKLWAFRHRRGSHWGRESFLFFLFNGIGILINDGVVALVHYGLGYHGNLAYNAANLVGIGLATLFRLYSYRRWVFLWAAEEAPAAEQLEPETSASL